MPETPVGFKRAAVVKATERSKRAGVHKSTEVQERAEADKTTKHQKRYFLGDSP